LANAIRMTDVDVRNYLEKIYQVPVMSVRTVARNGEYKRAPGKAYVIKDDDFRMAYVQLPKEVAFEFPDLFPKQKDEEEDRGMLKSQKQMRQNESKQALEQAKLKHVPTWFGL
jgi:large subunit ribosomal protein L23